MPRLSSKLSKKRETDLVLFRASLGEGLKLAWTVSIPDGYKSPLTDNTPWCHLSPQMQYYFFRDHYIPKVLETQVHSYYAVFELNKNGILHMHALCYVVGEEKYGAYMLQTVRQNLKFIQLVQRIVKRGRFVTLNHVVECTRMDDWEEYLNKDSESMPLNPIIKRSRVSLEPDEYYSDTSNE